jgi:hypothetical protein
MKYKDIIKDNNKNSLDYLTKKFKDHQFSERHNSISSSKRSKNMVKIFNDNQDEIFEIQNKNKENNKDDLNLNINKVTDINLVFTKGENYLKEDMLIDKTEDSLRVAKLKRGNPYIINASDICCFIFCCRNIKKKQKIFQNAEEKFNHNIDLVTFMKKMQEVEILKYLLLDRNTLRLMNFISKPCISMSNSNIEDEEYKEFFGNIEDSNSVSNEIIDNAKKSYDNIIAKKDMSYTEKRIIELFDLQIQDIFA